MKKPVDFFHRLLRFLLHRLVVPPYYPAFHFHPAGKEDSPCRKNWNKNLWRSALKRES